MGRDEAVAKKVVSPEEWRAKMRHVNIKKEDMNCLVMNYLVTQGYADAARQFSLESGVPLINDSNGSKKGKDIQRGTNDASGCGPTAMDVDGRLEGTSDTRHSIHPLLANIDDRMEVRASVQRGNIEAAINKVNDINPTILEDSDQIYFKLQQQRLIELIRDEKVEEALEFAHDYLAPRGEENASLLEELERTITLLAFDQPLTSPLSSLMEESHRQKTATEVNAAILSTTTASDSEPKLSVMMKMLVWAQEQLKDKHHCVFPVMTNMLDGTLTMMPTHQNETEILKNEEYDYMSGEDEQNIPNQRRPAV